jgi:hypothetical protein
MRTCETCAFWGGAPSARTYTYYDYSGIRYAACRRFAPNRAHTLPVNGLPDMAIWPLTRDNDWCGDHEPEFPPAGYRDGSVDPPTPTVGTR